MMNQEQQHQEIKMDVSTLQAMRRQEKNYMCGDYLYQQQEESRYRLNWPQQNGINVACRSSMLIWMQTVVNFIGFEPETVEIAMSYLDRFLQTPAGNDAMNCRTIFQLAAMTALYTAVKINCAEALTPKLLAELSQGSYQEDQFENMECIMLEALQWRVNPPTGTSLVHEIVDLIVASSQLDMTEELQQSIVETARLQAEFALGDYELVTIKKSIVAVAAVANALEHERIRGFHLQTFLQEVLVSGQQQEDSSLELDLKQASLVKKTLREALPADDGEEQDPSTVVLDMDSSSRSIGKSLQEDEDVPRKRMSAGRSPRSVIQRNVAHAA
ncbi:diatom-specific cyclin [Seminavis robusta]|uniref:Diatom-specific cyclin n=1 Tax=Seminavis robusta TaxID=568900 RepID=A0A9N8DWG5_9STRA|nr:diatom-specific cyclin [Seminavis robusta]|eukprot:Sro299_g111360.1 diatom-specific cyclin (329) ;mRNA; r:35910-36896